MNVASSLHFCHPMFLLHEAAWHVVDAHFIEYICIDVMYNIQGSHRQWKIL